MECVFSVGRETLFSKNGLSKIFGLIYSYRTWTLPTKRWSPCLLLSNPGRTLGLPQGLECGRSSNACLLRLHRAPPGLCALSFSQDALEIRHPCCKEAHTSLHREALRPQQVASIKCNTCKWWRHFKWFLSPALESSSWSSRHCRADTSHLTVPCLNSWPTESVSKIIVALCH